MDGANLNAILGRFKPGEAGFDVMHFNVHKTFSTPHGGGGPGAGPIAVTESLAPFIPGPQVIRKSDGTYDWEAQRPESIGKVRSFFGQFGILVRAYAYIRGLGPSGLKNLSETAVLSANYLAARLKDHYEMPFPPPYAHEFIMVPQFRDQGVTELDVAKRLIDYGFHPPTMSWPIAHCLMIEPTESESQETLDQFVDAMISIAKDARDNPEVLHHAPHTTPVRRLDEVAAARKPNLRWRAPQSAAASTLCDSGATIKTVSPTHTST
jgi:glycine dehydrogenase subunit 2